MFITELPSLTRPPNVTNTTTTSVTLQWDAWNPDAGDTGDGPIDGYNIYYTNINTGIDMNGGFVSSLGQTHSIFSETVENLQPNTPYSVHVKAVREGPGGEGSASPSIEVSTLSKTTTAKPTTSEPRTTPTIKQSTSPTTTQQLTTSGVTTTTSGTTQPSTTTSVMLISSSTTQSTQPSSSTKAEPYTAPHAASASSVMVTKPQQSTSSAAEFTYSTDGIKTKSQGKFKLVLFLLMKIATL